MKLFLDESVPKIIKEVLFNFEVPVVDVIGLGLSGSDDEVVFEEAQKRRRTFVTVDLRFVTRIFLSKRKHYGVILLRYKGKVSAGLLRVLTGFLKKYQEKELKDILIVIDREKFRIRKI